MQSRTHPAMHLVAVPHALPQLALRALVVGRGEAAQQLHGGGGACLHLGRISCLRRLLRRGCQLLKLLLLRDAREQRRLHSSEHHHQGQWHVASR